MATKDTNRELQSELERLRQQLSVKEATLHSARAALAQAETQLNGEIQQLTAELTHERQRRRKRELELKHAVAELAAIREEKAESILARESIETATCGSDTATADELDCERRWRFSSAQKRRWKSL